MVATLLAVLLIKFTLAVAPSAYNDRCPEGIEPMKDFDINRYLGRWYEYAQYSDEFSLRVRCVHNDYTNLLDGTIQMNSTLIYVPSVYFKQLARAQVVGPGKLTVCYEKLADSVGHLDYWILGTDYNNYAVAYACQTLLPIHLKFVWVLRRHPTLTAEQIEATHQILTKQSLDLRRLFKTDHTNCDEYYK